ncbi:MAG: YceI family protein [Candidatus Methylomirabilales bacterium]
MAPHRLAVIVMVGQLLWLPSGTEAAPDPCSLPTGAEKRPAAGVLLTLRPGSGKVTFHADARLHEFTGTTREVSGWFRTDDLRTPTEATGCVGVEAASLETGIGLRDTKMRTNHLETDRYPDIVYRVNAIVRVGDQLLLAGTLTLHGVSRSVRVPIQITPLPDGARVKGAVTLDIRDYDIPIPRFLFVRMKPEVVVTFDTLWQRIS